jgi:hypothetical protein
VENSTTKFRTAIVGYPHGGAPTKEWVKQTLLDLIHNLRSNAQMLSWSKKIFLSFILGALTFTPWQILLVRFEIVEYKNPAFLGIANWVPFSFGAATCLAILLFMALERLLISRIDFVAARLVYEYFLIAGFYIAILFFHTSPYLLSLSLMGVILTRFIFVHRPWDFIYFLLGVCIGPTIELTLNNFNLYFFTEPDFLGMPYWLPLLWGEVAIALRRVVWVLEPEVVNPPVHPIHLQ